VPPDHFHPDLRRVARVIPKQVITPATLPIVRLATRLMGRHTPDDVEVLTLTSGVGVRLYRPTGPSRTGPALLWIHGGGYLIGSAAQDDQLCRRFARELGATVASVAYRLAPENPYPVPLEDCYTALAWLVGLPSVDPARVAIGGASAGGGLAAALALLARDRGEIPDARRLAPGHQKQSPNQTDCGCCRRLANRQLARHQHIADVRSHEALGTQDVRRPTCRPILKLVNSKGCRAN